MSLSEVLPTTAIDTASEFTHRSAQATVSEGLAQGPYVAARAGFEPTTPVERHRLYQCATTPRNNHDIEVLYKCVLGCCTADSNLQPSDALKSRQTTLRNHY